MADLSGHLRLPRVGLGATRPLQTLIDPRAVKPDACPGTCTHASTTMLIHGPEQEHQGPTEGSQQSICAHPQAAAATAGPTTCHGVGDTGQWCTVQDMMHKVRTEPLDHRTRCADTETGEACQRTSHSPQSVYCATGGRDVSLVIPASVYMCIHLRINMYSHTWRLRIVQAQVAKGPCNVLVSYACTMQRY
jgi:hypothetical protein